MLKRLSIALIAVLLVAGVALVPTRAQAQESLKYGDSVDGEITAEVKEVTYSFTGKKDDTVIFQIIPLENSDGSTLDIGAILSDSSGTKLIDANEDYAKIFVGAYAKAFVEFLPADGDYTLTISSHDTTSVGKFTLQIFQPEAIDFDQPVSVSSEFKGYSRYLAIYTIPSDKPFTLILSQDEGDTGLSVDVLEYSNDFMRTVASAEASNASEVGFTMRAGSVDKYFITIASPGYVVADSTLKYSISAKLLE